MVTVTRRRTPVALVGLAIGCLTAAWPLVGSGSSARAAATTVEVIASPGGTGTACSAASPCSLATAQAAARQAASTAAVDVELTDGTYRLAQPLRLTVADSGQNGHTVTYRAAAGAHPVLSGGQDVAGWVLADPARNLWSAHVPPGTRSRQLFVNGRRAPRATGSLPGVWHQTATGYTTTDTAMASWRNPSNVELVFNQGNGFWTEPRCDVAALAPTAGGTAITVRQPCWSNLHIPDQPATTSDPTAATDDNAAGGFEGMTAATNPTRVENAYELLTTAGQWYFDEAAGTIYYQAGAAENVAGESFVLPVTQTLVEGAGTLDAPVHDLELRGLTFAFSTWLQPSGDNGFAEMQSNVTLTGENASGSVAGSTVPPQGMCQYSTPAGSCPFAGWTKEPAAVTFHAAHSVRLVGNTFAHLGAAGVNFDYGSQGNRVEGNEITDTSGNGVILGDTIDPQPIGGDTREINQGNTIANNYVHEIAAEYPGGVGIWVGYTRGTTVTHNEIAHTPYSAISFGWGGWHTDTLRPDNPSIVGNNAVTDNLIYDYLRTLPDGGAIYTNGTQGPFDPLGPASNPFLTGPASPTQMARGLTLSGNVALLATWSEFAYYNDEGADYVTWKTNVEYQAHAFATGGCNTVGHIAITDNYWAQPMGGYICPPPPVDMQISNHHIIPDHPGPGDIPDSVLAAAGLEPAYWSLVTSRAPEVTGVGPQAGLGPVLVSGSGFTTDAVVYFGTPGPTTKAVSVRVLSTNYLVATPPAGVVGQVDIFVATAAGTSGAGAGDQFIGA